jgi:hypothetical protein
VMRHAREDRHGRRLRAIVVVLWRAGLRVQEALALSERDPDARRGSLLVRQGKGRRRREIGMDDWGWEQIQPWLAAPSSSRWARCSAASTGRPAGDPGQAPPSAASSAGSPPRPVSAAASRRTSCGTPTPWSSPETVPGLGARRQRPASATRVGEQRNGRRSRRHARVRRVGQRLPQPAWRRISAHGRAAARRRDRQSRAGERCSPSHVRPVAWPEATTRTTSVYRSLGVLRASAEIVGRRASLEPALVSVGSARANFAARVRQSLLSPGATQGPYARTSRPVESRHERSRPCGPTRADRAPCAAACR